MIYLLGDFFESECGLSEVVDMATTDIQNIFNYLSLDNLDLRVIMDKEIVIMPNGRKDKYELAISLDMLSRFDVCAPAFINECDEYEEMRTKISSWCDKINKELQERRLREEEEKRRIKEEKDRAIYEKLKAKYES